MFFLYIYEYIYTSLYVKIIDKKNKQTYKITPSPDTNIPESTWEYKITNNNNIYIKRKLLIKFRFTDWRIYSKKWFVKSLTR